MESRNGPNGAPSQRHSRAITDQRTNGGPPQARGAGNRKPFSPSRVRHPLPAAASPNHCLPHQAHVTPPTPRQGKAPQRKQRGKQKQPPRTARPQKQSRKREASRPAAGRMARGLRGVRDDLSELGRHLLDIACFLHPLLNPAHTDSPPPTPTGRRRARRSPSPHPAAPPSPSLLAGILSDLAEIGGSFRGGFSRSSPAPDHPAPDALESQQAASSPSPRPPPPAAADQIADDVVGAARALAARPEAWIDFPVLALDEGNYLFSALAPTRLRLFATSANIGICLRRLRLCWWLMLPVEWFPGVGVKVAGYGSCYTC